MVTPWCRLGDALVPPWCRLGDALVPPVTSLGERGLRRARAGQARAPTYPPQRGPLCNRKFSMVRDSATKINGHKCHDSEIGAKEMLT